jgi:hypothetical protein
VLGCDEIVRWNVLEYGWCRDLRETCRVRSRKQREDGNEILIYLFPPLRVDLHGIKRSGWRWSWCSGMLIPLARPAEQSTAITRSTGLSLTLQGMRLNVTAISCLVWRVFAGFWSSVAVGYRTNFSVVTLQVALVSKCGVDRGGWPRLYFLQEVSARVFVFDPINVGETNVFGRHRRLV